MSTSDAHQDAIAPQRSPLMELLTIAAPVVATMTSYTLMQFVDKLIVSRIGPEPIYVGAQGNGGLCAFVPIAVSMGGLTIINTYVSQNLGAKTPERAPAYAWAGLWLSAIFWLVLMVPYGFLLPQLLGWVRAVEPDPVRFSEILRRDELAVSYGRILIWGSLITMWARAIQQYFYGMHRPGIVLTASVIGNIVNLVLDVLLVFGPSAPAPTDYPWINAAFDGSASLAAALGIPAMGMRGAAIATVVGTAIELAIPMCLFLSAGFNRVYGTLSAWRPSAPHMRDLLRLGWPAALMFGNEMVCWAIFMVAQVGHFGPEHSTAGWIAHQWMSLSFMPTYGISVAITATIGKCMGMGRPDLAQQRAWLGLKLAVAYMTCCAVVFVVFRHQLIDMFVETNTPAETRAFLVVIGGRFLIATAAFQFFDGIAMTLSGALRGAGDTQWVGIVTVVLAWTVIVGGGWALVLFVPALESLGPWIAAAAYIIILSLAILSRFLAGKWRDIRLVDSPAATR